MKKKLTNVYTIAVLLLVVVLSCVSYQAAQDKKAIYHSAIDDIVQEQYAEAKTKLRPLSEIQYRDTEELYAFCVAMEYYSKYSDGKVSALQNALKYTENCNFYEQEDDVRNLLLARKKIILDAKSEYDAEQERIRLEEEAEEARKEHEKFLRNIHEGVPYVGMSEAYINDTFLGKYSDSYTNTNIENNKRVKGTGYFWKKDGYQIFFAFCKHGEVVDAVDQRGSIEAQKQRKAEKKKATQKKKTQSADPYNAKDYGYASDFYEDYYDEFYDAVDAEDYWEEHYYE